MNTVNLFFACDDNYIPFLAVTLSSIRKHADPRRHYAVRVLNTGVDEEHRKLLTEQFTAENFSMEFVDITAAVEQFSARLHTRDYYSKSTYYRLFIPELFPDLDKALYLDCDIVLQSDVAALYDTALGNALVGAVPDGMVQVIDAFRQYVSKRLHVKPACYFNAGVLLMNLKAMRACHFTEVFIKLLQKVTFRVAQDQDYLNVICKGRVKYLGDEWNTMPGCSRSTAPKLIHYNLDCKPWQRDDVAYGDIFWDHAEGSGFLPAILTVRAGFTQERIEFLAQQTRNLVALGQRQANQWTQNMYINWKIKRVVHL